MMLIKVGYSLGRSVLLACTLFFMASVAAAAPGNDAFANASLLTGASCAASGSNVLATVETGEPNHGAGLSKTGGKSVWWKWTSSTGGLVTISNKCNFAHLLAIYTGADVAGLTLVTNAAASANAVVKVSFAPLSGTTYYIAMDGQSGASGTNFLGITLQSPPANDMFADASLLTGVSLLASGSNTVATLEPGEPDHGAGLGKTGGKSVWWSWTASTGGMVAISNKSSVAHLLAIYAGADVAHLTLVTNVAGTAGAFAKVTFPPSAGTTYRIAFDGQSGASGTNLLGITLQSPPANDLFSNAYVLSGTTATSSASNTLATVEPGEPEHGAAWNTNGGKSVWWTWTAPSGGLLQVSNKCNFAHMFVVYSGDSLANLTRVAGASNAANAFAVASFNPIAGTPYFIAMDGVGGASGTNLLQLNLIPPPPNDDFSGASLLVGTNLVASGTNLAAIVEPGEPNHGAGLGIEARRSIWWTWTAPFTGWVQVTNKASVNHILAVYSGTDLNSLSLLANGTNAAIKTVGLSFYCASGATYQFAVASQTNSGGTNLLTLLAQPLPANDAFTNAFVLSGDSILASGTNFLGTTEPGEPNHGETFGKTGGRSIWWTWTAPSDGLVTLSNYCNYAHLLAVYLGDSVTNLSRVTSATNGSAKWAGGSFYAIADKMYQIAVDGQSGASGTNLLKLNFIAAPANDKFADAIPLVGSHDSGSGSNVSASLESAEPTHGSAFGSTASRSVWWKWTATGRGLALVQDTANFDHLLAIYSGNTLSDLALVASDYGSTNDTVELGFNPVPGTVYWFAVASRSASSGTNFITVDLMPPPSNDMFANRIAVQGNTVHITGSNDFATKELGEPNHSGLTGGPSVWWSWTPSAAGWATISLDSEFKKILAVYTGSSLSSLKPVASDGPGYSTVGVNFSVLPGIEYQIAVDGNDLFSYGPLAMDISVQAPPANDNFANAFVLPVTNASVLRATNWGATLEPGEPSPDELVGGHSVWWVWTATNTAHYSISLEAYFNKLVTVYAGDSLTNLAVVGRSSWPAAQWSNTGFDAVAGVAYHISVDGLNGDSGLFSFSVQETPANDDFENATPLSSSVVQLTGNSAGATRQAGEPNHAGNTSGRSVWWAWTAPRNGRVSLSTVSSTFSPAITVYTGSSLTNLTGISVGVGSQSSPAYANFDAVAGRSYLIAVDGRYSDGGIFSLSLSYVTPPPNDYFVDAIDVPIKGGIDDITNSVMGDFSVSGSNVGATKEAGEIYGNSSVWWKWTAPADGELLLELESYSPCTLVSPWVELYTGTSVDTLVAVYSRMDFSASEYHDRRYPVKAGTSYYIWVANRGGSEGTYTLDGTFEGRPPNDDFANRMPIVETNLLTWGYLYRYGWNCVATKEPGEPRHGNNIFGGKSVWWTWEAPYDGFASLRVDSRRYGFSTMIGVYTGNAVNNLTVVTNAYANAWNAGSTVRFPIQKGVNYQIAIDGGGTFGDSGEYRMELQIQVDIVAPEVKITSPAFAQTFYSSTVAVSGTADDIAPIGLANYATGLKSVEVRVNGGDWQSASGTAIWSATVPLTVGYNLIEARATDLALNSAIASVHVYRGTALSGCEVTPDGFKAKFLTEGGKNYRLEWTDSLEGTIVWTPVNSTPIIGVDGLTLSIIDIDKHQKQRFYRLLAW